MKRKNEYGKKILSAGEIATYVVCPEAWKLEYLEDKKPKYPKTKSKKGKSLHSEWTQNADDAIYFTWGVRLIFFLIILSIIIFILSK